MDFGFHTFSLTVGLRGRGRGSGPGRGRGMLNKNKKMRGKPWTGRGRGRGGDQGMDDAAPVSVSSKINADRRTPFVLKRNCGCDLWLKL